VRIDLDGSGRRKFKVGKTLDPSDLNRHVQPRSLRISVAKRILVTVVIMRKKWVLEVESRNEGRLVLVRFRIVRDRDSSGIATLLGRKVSST
jgi:hypothetical protein